MEGIVTTGCTMDFTKYPYDSHRCKYIMGSTGFADSLMRFDSTFTFSESAQRPLQYTVRFQTTLGSWIKVPVCFIQDFCYVKSSANRTPNFTNPEFQFLQSKVLLSVFFLFNITSYIGIFGCILILTQNFYLEKVFKK